MDTEQLEGIQMALTFHTNDTVRVISSVTQAKRHSCPTVWAEGEKLPPSIHHVSIVTVRTQTPGSLTTATIPESLRRAPARTVPWTAAILLSNHLFPRVSRQQAARLMRSWEWSMEGCDGRGSKHRKAEEVPIYNSC